MMIIDTWPILLGQKMIIHDTGQAPNMASPSPGPSWSPLAWPSSCLRHLPGSASHPSIATIFLSFTVSTIMTTRPWLSPRRWYDHKHDCQHDLVHFYIIIFERCLWNSCACHTKKLPKSISIWLIIIFRLTIVSGKSLGEVSWCALI